MSRLPTLVVPPRRRLLLLAVLSLAVLAVLLWPSDGYGAGHNSITSRDTTGYVGQFTSLALDASGNPVVSYCDIHNAVLKVPHGNDPNCSGEDEITPTPTPAETTTATPTATPTPTDTTTAMPTATPTPRGPRGDVNCDSTVNSIDAALVLQFDARLVLSLRCQENADVNDNGSINAIDAALILQYEAGLIDMFPQGKRDDDPAWGPEDAIVTITEFGDFECSHCARFAIDTLPLLMENYGDQVRFVYRDFPIYPDALKAAEAAQCAHDQGEFWEYHDLLLQNQGALDVNSLKAYAASLGLHSAVFNACLDSDKHLAEVMNDRQDGEAAGVNSVPSFFVNGFLIKGARPYSEFEAAIEAALSEIHSLGGG